ncbi:hypothetical protein PMAYCL1PPCAC_05847 [Pristionchus mayeri]|uniref:Uncharacterized protein n=1 Tax=Pristionchus mayeri TaxID=1317129 RepID=A0AAN4ZDA1_9BILA|nr:hypothetical protein PMAYCL1PPCAC_05847 [Pristionchus mayeri]
MSVNGVINFETSKVPNWFRLQLKNLNDTDPIPLEDAEEVVWSSTKFFVGTSVITLVFSVCSLVVFGKSYRHLEERDSIDSIYSSREAFGPSS